ncbi:hypothetical protein C463_05975 [Halorubrum californiense DSM 19288]|uniref:Uncharacterized protein n=1 Tax=Halorubrum californiense DSM 19288 TaxID=1227465 RepID=M0EDY7_9EURY|nr:MULTISPECIES: hypothetical protein [Halorubrum]ELZ45955.1 hypothetical protein C463_05975 [Halorubrum californiense DSM 19288]TKX72338.1 hypothetical protein EXE40_04505 [Halorubrum sp. GN11GM_10-3_MGM]
MADRPGGDESVSTTAERESTDDTDGDPTSDADPLPDGLDDAGVDEAVKRRLREAYLNDEENALIVTRVRSVGDRVAVEMRPPHGDATHTERFDAPRDGSLRESEAFLEFLEAAGVSPLDVDELVGTRVPATYDTETGWRVDPEFRGESASTGENRLADARDWLWAYRAWLVAGLLVGGELVFVAVLILLYA